MRRRLLAAGFAAILLFAMGAAPAGAQVDMNSSDAAITADLTATGVRTIQSVPAITLSTAFGTEDPSGTWTVIVAETVRSGTNPWIVSAELCDTITCEAAKLVTTGGEIGGENIDVATDDVDQTLGGGALTAGPGGSLDDTVELFGNTGQNTALLYTGTYTGSGTLTLTPPAGVPAAIYTGFLRVDLLV